MRVWAGLEWRRQGYHAEQQLVFNEAQHVAVKVVVVVGFELHGLAHFSGALQPHGHRKVLATSRPADAAGLYFLELDEVHVLMAG